MARQRKKKIELDNILKQIDKEATKTLFESSITNISEERKKEIIEKENDTLSIWENEKILSFHDFVRSPEHMNFPELSERQLAVAEYLLGNDPKKMFDNGRHTAVLVWGKGCVTEDMCIYTYDGKRLTAKESFENNIPFVSWGFYNNQISNFLSTPFIKKPEKEDCFLFVTSSGSSIKVSADHKFYTPNGWIKAKDLNKKDLVYMVINYDIPNVYNWITQEEAYVNGLIFACKNFKGLFNCSENYRAYKTLDEYIKKRIGNIKWQKDGKVIDKLKKILTENNLHFFEKRVPVEYIFTNSYSRLAFLRGFFDGFLRNSDISYDLYRDIDFMLRSFGIILKFNYRKNKLINPFKIRFILNNIIPKKNTPQLIEERIIIKKYIGKQDVYTPTVPISKNYVLNNFINHNSGKDTISALIQLYIVYVLLHLKSPQAFFDKGPQSSIDLLNIASTREQAQEVYFQLLRKFILNWTWLKNKYEFVLNGRFYSAPANQDMMDITNKVIITNESIVFPKNIQMFSGSSEADSSEGKNLLVFVLDEADAFKSNTSRSAERIYRMCRTSAFSRFKNRYKGLIISYPRSEKGFILSLYNSVKDNIEYYCDKAATWEVLPSRMFSNEYFDFNGKKIPIDFYEEFKMDPVGAQLAYMVTPVQEANKYIEIENLTTPFAEKERAIFEFKDFVKVEEREQYICKDIIYLPKKIPKGAYSIAFDLAVKEDNCALCLAHLIDDKIVIDFVTAWVPNPEENIKVSLNNVNEIVIRMADVVKPVVIAGDSWNSALLCQSLQSKGYNAKIIKITHEDYLIFRRFLLNGNIFLPKDQELLNEIKDLYYERQDKIDHPEGKHDDRFMACLIAFKSLLNINQKENNLLVEGEIVKNNLKESDFFIDSIDLNEEGDFINKNLSNLGFNLIKKDIKYRNL